MLIGKVDSSKYRYWNTMPVGCASGNRKLARTRRQGLEYRVEALPGYNLSSQSLKSRLFPQPTSQTQIILLGGTHIFTCIHVAHVAQCKFVDVNE